MNYDYEQLVYTLVIFWESSWIINFCKCNLEKWGNDKMSAKIGIPFQRVSTIFLTILSKCHNIYFIHISM